MNNKAFELYFSQTSFFDEKEKGKDANIVEMLLRGGFYVSNPNMEIRRAVDLCMSKRYDPTVFNATIIPTNECNLNCSYCFVKRNGNFMSSQVIEASISYFQRLIESKNQKLLHFCTKWFGGEPFLRCEIIDKISEEVIKLCDFYSIDYHAMAYSNLTILPQNIEKKLLMWRITKINTTLDGVGADNDIRRISKNGASHFNGIIQNICRLREHARINIQVNIDRRNLDTVQFLIEYLVENGIVDGKKVTVGFSLVNDNENIENKHVLLGFDDDDFMRKVDSLYSILGKHASISLPTQSLQCFAAAKNSVVVDSMGNLYKCYREDKSNCSFGNVLDPSYTYTEAELAFLQNNPITKPECRECNVFPICFGGCYNMIDQSLICSKKFILEQSIKRYFRNRGDGVWTKIG